MTLARPVDLARNLSNLSNSGNFSIPGKSWDDAMAARVIVVIEEICIAAGVIGTSLKHAASMSCRQSGCHLGNFGISVI